MSKTVNKKNKPIGIKSKITSLSIAVVSAVLLTITGVVAISSIRPNSEATDMTIIMTIEDVSPSITISLEDGMTDNEYNGTLRPSAVGAITSLESNVRVVAENTYGFELYINTSNSGGNAVGSATGSTVSPMPGIIDNPIPFTQMNCNSWGFATPRQAGSFSAGFDPSYTALTNVDTTATTSNFASVPTTATPIYDEETLAGNVAMFDVTQPYYFAFCATPNIVADAYEANITWTAIAIDEPPLPPVAENGDFIQDVTNATCPETRTWVVDARDNKTYWIRKIPASGAGSTDLCWMETNLAYAGGGTNTFGDIMTITQNTSGGLGNSPAGYRVSNPPSGTPVFTTSPTPPTTGSGANTGANGAQYGYLYNWCAAMGRQSNACNNTETNQANLDTTVNICPSGWRLPVGNSANDASVNDFSALNNTVNSGSTSSDAGLRSNWLGVYAGLLYTPGSFDGVGSSGYYWSSSVNTATTARNLSFNSSNVNSANNLSKANGFSVRCVR